jgi:hypothetical protein
MAMPRAGTRLTTTRTWFDDRRRTGPGMKFAIRFFHSLMEKRTAAKAA